MARPHGSQAGAPHCLALSQGTGDDLEAWFDALRPYPEIAVLLREKSWDDRRLFEAAGQTRRRLPRHRLLVHGRWDLAQAAGADGVHLPSDGLPVAALRRHLGSEFWIGVSTHTPAEISLAREAGASYAVFGPILPTPGKSEGSLAGIAGLAAAAGAVDAAHGTFPILALGGIEPCHLPSLLSAGAFGVAGIRSFQSPVHFAGWSRAFQDLEAPGSHDGASERVPNPAQDPARPSMEIYE